MFSYLGIHGLMYDNKTEHLRTINILERFNIYQEVILGVLYRLLSLKVYASTCEGLLLITCLIPNVFILLVSISRIQWSMFIFTSTLFLDFMGYTWSHYLLHHGC